MQIIQTFDAELIAHLNKEVHELHSNLYPEHFKPYDFNSIHSFFQGIIANPEYQFLVIKDEEKYLGYAWIEERDHQENAFVRSYKSLFVHQISILEAHRHKGLGLMLMNRTEEIAKNKDIHRIELSYWTGNDGAKRFYEKNGFKVYKESVHKEIK